MFTDISVQVSKSGDVFTYTSTAGHCQVTNSYEFAPDGMKQFKMVPLTAPKEFCSAGTTEYFAEPAHSGGSLISVFKGLPLDGCSTIDVVIDSE